MNKFRIYFTVRNKVAKRAIKYLVKKNNNKVTMTDNNITTVRPFLNVNNGKKAVDFYISAFGAIEEKRFEIKDTKISSVIKIDNATFYVADEEPHNGNVCPDETSARSIRIILQTKKADELFEKALRFGAIEICPMTSEEDWRIGKLKDPFGHIWEIGYTL